ncbi:MAG: cellulase family glycosylhydrolase [Sediminicola sp.]
MKKSILVLVLCITNHLHSQGFLHRDHQNIVDGEGKNIVLRGLGLGGWMVQEGYMLKTQSFAGPQHLIRQKITDLIGPQNTAAFYEAYLANGITKRDVDSLASWGFNSLRLPMHYNLYTPPIAEEKEGEISFLEKGFAMTDSLLQWCAANKMYLILDLHAAPGGQGNDANISDYDTSKPSLWESEANQKKMIALWRALALRYKDNPWIGAYDIINEPNWNFTGTNKNGCDETSNAPLRELMVAVTKAIREVDTNHLIFIEGNCWGNNYNGIFPLWDDNMALSFHKYWNYNDQASLGQILDYRAKYDVPIWMGEGGENSNVWFRDAISLFETNNIGWAFWPMKKIANTAGVTSVPITKEYSELLAYWEHGGEKPSVEYARSALMEIAENYKMENLTINKDVIDAMFRQVQTVETKAYKEHSLPGIVYATEYDLGPHEHAYFDTDIVNYRVSTGENTVWNKGRAMRNDGVDIEKCTDKIGNGFHISHIADGEWLLYTVTVTEEAVFDVDLRISDHKGGARLYLADGNGRISETLALPKSGEGGTWQTVTLKDVRLQKRTNKVKIHFEKGGFNLNYLAFKLP